jgi:hypothetical protein
MLCHAKKDWIAVIFMHMALAVGGVCEGEPTHITANALELVFKNEQLSNTNGADFDQKDNGDMTRCDILIVDPMNDLKLGSGCIPVSEGFLVGASPTLYYVNSKLASIRYMVTKRVNSY